MGKTEPTILGVKPSSRKPHVIYALVDPRTGLPFYVGRSKGGWSRMIRHVQPAIVRSDRTKAKGRRILEILAEGLAPTFMILETHRSWDECKRRECVLIAKLRQVYDLQNDEFNRPRRHERAA